MPAPPLLEPEPPPPLLEPEPLPPLLAPEPLSLVEPELLDPLSSGSLEASRPTVTPASLALPPVKPLTGARRLHAVAATTAGNTTYAERAPIRPL